MRQALHAPKQELIDRKMPENFEGKGFDVEHVMVLYASNFVTMSAVAIYEDEVIRPHLGQIRDCHIYLIGLMPKIEIADLKQEGAVILLPFSTWLTPSVKYAARFHRTQGLLATGQNYM